uniref:ARAD1D40700p n=1 Tax=Blastobotrys adeninivorans TaxID=409370 RepID=A0A060TCQ9_BLAAD
MERAIDITATLDVLVRDLRNNSFEAPTPPQNSALHRAVFYLPSIRNEPNIGLLVNELALSPHIIRLDDRVLVSALYLSEGIKSAAVRKAQITSPTIDLPDWVDAILRTCLGIEYNNPTQLWRTVPILCGLIKAKGLQGAPLLTKKQMHAAQKLMTTTISRFISQPDKAPLLVFCLAKVQSEIDVNIFESSIVHDSVLLGTVDLLYGPLGLNWESLPPLCTDQNARSSHPVFTHLSDLSHLVKLCVQQSRSNDSLDIALNAEADFINTCARYFDQIAPNSDAWNVYKLCLFGICIQLEGYASVMMTRRGFDQGPSTYFALKILRTLAPIYFVVLELGASGFPPYDFIYYTSIDILTSHVRPEDGPSIERAARLLAGMCNLGTLRPSLVERGILVYTLDFFEHIIKLTNTGFIDNFIFPITRLYLAPRAGADIKYVQPILESAHSVLLAYLTKVSGRVEDEMSRHRGEDNTILDRIIPEYTETTLNLFPTVLSSDQLRFALATVLSVVSSTAYLVHNPNMVDRMLILLYQKCIDTPSGLLLPQKPGEEESDKKLTARGVLGSCLIHSIPFIESRQKFIDWLENAKRLLESSGSERAYLYEELWAVISNELSLSLADVGIKWWYQTKL